MKHFEFILFYLCLLYFSLEELNPLLSYILMGRPLAFKNQQFSLKFKKKIHTNILNIFKSRKMDLKKNCFMHNSRNLYFYRARF